ncbi:hypothetical protein Tco_0307096 [Tanacetum coccineum]
MCLFMTILRLLTFQKINLRIFSDSTLNLHRLMKIPFSSKHVEYVVGHQLPILSQLALIGDGDCYVPEVGSIEDYNSFNKDEPFCSPTTHSELSLPDYKAFYIDNDHFKEKSSGSTTTHADFSKYDSFIFDLSINSYHPSNRSDFH